MNGPATNESHNTTERTGFCDLGTALSAFSRTFSIAAVLAATLSLSTIASTSALTISETPPIPVEKPKLDAEGKIVVKATLENGLRALDTGNIDETRLILGELPDESLDRQILTWGLISSPSANLPLEELTAFANELADWPGQATIRANTERAIYRQNPAPDLVLSLFAKTPPETMAGRIARARALLRLNRLEDASIAARAIWVDPALDNRTAAVFEVEFGRFLTAETHLLRMKKLLYRDRITLALAPARKARAESLYQAWVQTIRTPARALTAIDDIDDAFKDDPAVTYLKIRRLRQLDKSSQAAELLQSMPKRDTDLVDPEEWWIEQRIISRDLFEKGDIEDAYRVASAHQATDPAIAAEAEFHAGWYALRGLDQPLLARTHFQSLLQLAISDRQKARANYWLARSSQTGGNNTTTDEARAFYERAAAYPTSFYGQLARAALDQAMPAFRGPEISAQARARHIANPVVAAIAQLRAIKQDQRADLFARELARQTGSVAEIALLAQDATTRDDHRLALQIGRIGLTNGLDVATFGFPLGALPADANITGAGLALTYAVARQESAFHIAAVSPANARGLLQLLPGTARGVASRHELAYSPQRLTTDAGYNATLGAYYLGEQIDRFGGSYILTFIAYNAGPKRVSEWIGRFGDPRGKPIEEVVDWVEKIPFPETRDYVQRVLENYEVYKTRLSQPADIAADLRFGRTN